jgi:hypothetical protein
MSRKAVLIIRNLNPQKIICMSFRSASWGIPTRQTDIMDSDLKGLFDYGNGVSSEDIIKRYPSIHTKKDLANCMRPGIRILELCMSVDNSRRYIPSFSENELEGK